MTTTLLGCSASSQWTSVEATLSREQELRQEALLRELPSYEQLEGADISKYQELLTLADYVTTETGGPTRIYWFVRPGTGDDGSDTDLQIIVSGDTIIECIYEPINH